MYRVGKDIRVRQQGKGAFDYQGIAASYRRLQIHVLGEYQVTNAATAVGIVELLNKQGYAVNETSLKDGLRETRWPGRLELIHQDPKVLLDGAHNLAAIEKLTHTLSKDFSYRKLFLVIGIMEDKSIKPILKRLVPLGDHIIFTRPKIERAASPAALLKAAGSMPGRVEVIEDVKQAVRNALVRASSDDLICVTGSLFAVGEARELFSPTVEI